MKFLKKTLSVACLTAAMTFVGLMVTNTQSQAATAATHTFVGYAEVHYYTFHGTTHDYALDPTHYDAYLIH